MVSALLYIGKFVGRDELTVTPRFAHVELVGRTFVTRHVQAHDKQGRDRDDDSINQSLRGKAVLLVMSVHLFFRILYRAKIRKNTGRLNKK